MAGDCELTTTVEIGAGGLIGVCPLWFSIASRISAEFSAAVDLNVKLIRELDLVLFAARCLEGKIEPPKTRALGQCLRLGI
jgi:hypothetical protein